MPAPKINPFNDPVLTDDAAATEELGSADQAQPQEPAPVQQADQGQPPPVQQQADQVVEPPNKTGVVPYDRFKEVNERAKAAEKEAADLREKWARMDERARQAAEGRQAAEQAREAARRAAERPDPAVDPVGADLWDMKTLLAQERAARQAEQARWQQTAQGLQQNQEEAQFAGWVNQQAQHYATQDPAYFEKATFAANERIEFWQQLGLAPEAARDIVQKESVLLAKIAQQNGVNFAPIVAKLAAKWGYQAPQQQNGNGQRLAVQSPQAQQNAARLETVRNGQRAQGLGHIPGTGAEGATSYRNYTASQLAAMSDGEFNAVKANPQKWAELQYAIAIAEGLDPAEMGRL